MFTSESYTQSTKKLISCRLALCDNLIGYHGLLAILRMFKTKNCFITTIDFDDTKFYATEQDVLAAKYLTPITERFRTHSTLTTLYMSKSSLSNGTHLKSLEIAAKEGLLNNLEDIHLSKALTDDPLKNGAILITLLPSMATYCFRLKYFDISDNKLDVTAAQALGKAFVQFTTGKKDFELDLSTTCLNSISTRAFCSSVMATTLQTKLPRRIQPSNIEINFSHNPLGHYGLSAIFQMLNSDSCLVTNLTLNDIAEVERSNDTIKEIHMEEVTTSRGASKLTCFSFDGNKAFEEGLHIECLEVASKQGAFVLLQELNLSNTLSDCATLNGVLLSKFVVSIASECPYLMKLDLSNNRLNSRTGAQALGQTLPILCNAGKDFTLNLSDCHLNTDSIKTFSESAIVAFSSTTQPQLNIPLEVSLDLSKNPIQCKGLVHILDIIICKSCSITSLDLSKTVTVEFPTPDLYKPDSEINCVNLQLKKLDFSENSFSESKLFILVEYMQVCRFLNKLNCCSCSLSTHEIITILERLRVSNIKLESLQEWDVSDCNIDDEGVHALLEYSQDLFPHLESIDLDNNLVSAVVYSKLKKKLEVSTHETEPIL